MVLAKQLQDCENFQLWITPRDIKRHNALIAERNALCFLVIETHPAEKAKKGTHPHEHAAPMLIVKHWVNIWS